MQHQDIVKIFLLSIFVRCLCRESQYGSKADECGEAYLFYGKALLELSRYVSEIIINCFYNRFTCRKKLWYNKGSRYYYWQNMFNLISFCYQGSFPYILLYWGEDYHLLWKLKGALCSELVKSRVPSIWFVWKIWHFPVTWKQKFGTKGHWAVLEHSPEAPLKRVWNK